MGDDRDLRQEVEALRENVRVLLAENERLAERGEDTLLLGLIAEEIGTLEDPENIVTIGLERVSILKDVPLCARCTIADGRAVIATGCMSSCTDDLTGISIPLPDSLVESPDLGPVLLLGEECRDMAVPVGPAGGFSPRTVLLIPVRVASDGVARVFVFADDRDDVRLPQMTILLHRAVDMMETRIDNLHLLQEMRVLNADLLQATKAKSDFLAGVSHELRTPLNSIIGFSGILLQDLAGPLNDEQRRQVEMINRSGRHLLSLIGSVLDLAKIEAGRIEVALSTFDPSPVVLALADMMRPLADEKGLALEVDVSAAPAAVTTDQARLEQILMNLLSNAIKFTESGNVGIEAKCAGDGTVSIAVHDTGVGIPVESQRIIFDEFHQLQPADGSGKHGGTGLGLAISRRLAHVLGGDITLVSAPGEGSTFALTLPVDGPAGGHA